MNGQPVGVGPGSEHQRPGPTTAPIRPLDSQMETPASSHATPRKDNLESVARGESCGA